VVLLQSLAERLPLLDDMEQSAQADSPSCSHRTVISSAVFRVWKMSFLESTPESWKPDEVIEFYQFK
jgi:hypothetical protein